MDYNGALQYLNSFINYEKIGYKDQRAFKLNRMRQLADIFKNPQDAFYAIHITGTKGKGSIASFTSNILIKAGLKVGLYTSPHLNSPLERIKLKESR